MATTTILEHYFVVPSPDAPTDQSLPLVHFDIFLLLTSPAQNLVFYEIPCSKSEFLEVIVPQLKTSLSLTLKHFLPYAGKIHVPLASSPGLPVSRYAIGDSLSLTIAESSSEFANLTGYNSRNTDEFYNFASQLPQAEHSQDFTKIPVLAVQITLFQNQGICIALNINHAIGDGATTKRFFDCWASITKFNGTPEAHTMETYLPSYDRSCVQDPTGLSSTRWNQAKMFVPRGAPSFVLPINEFQSTFVLTEGEIENLKDTVLDKAPELGHVSTFVVISAHIWICHVKSAAASGEEVGDDVAEYLMFPIDCRSRLKPPLPAAYFGNCLTVTHVESSYGKLKGNDGFICAVQAIKDAIRKIVENEKGIWDSMEKEFRELAEIMRKRVVCLSGSPRFDYYDADFGWGTPKKFEPLRPANYFSMFKSKSFKGGTEVSLSMSKMKMDSFTESFNEAFGKSNH